MFKSEITIIASIAVLMTVSLIPPSHAELWDLVILADIENGTILPGQVPIIAGMITDHASKPVGKVQVHIRTGQESIFAITDEGGQFRAILDNFNRIPGTYIVNVVGNAPDGKTGMTTTEFQIKGDFTRASILEEKLSTSEAQKYLSATVEDFAKDPIGFTLFNYYQKLYQEYLEEVKINEKLALEQMFIEEQKSIADELREKAIEEFNPHAGVFSGYKYDDYVRNLNPEVKDTIINQLNFTKNLFEEAQRAREQILLSGGTAEEARQAYLEKIAITQETLYNFGTNITEIDNTSQNSTETELIEIPIEETSVLPYDQDETPFIDVNGTDIKVGFDGKTVFVNVNGTIIEFFVNATGIYQID